MSTKEKKDNKKEKPANKKELYGNERVIQNESGDVIGVSFPDGTTMQIDPYGYPMSSD